MAENIRRVKSEYRLFKDDKGQTHYYQKPYFKLVDGKLSLFACPPSKNALSLNDLSHISSRTIDKGARYPFLSKLNLLSISTSLKAERDLNPWSLASLTKGSLSCL